MAARRLDERRAVPPGGPEPALAWRERPWARALTERPRLVVAAVLAAFVAIHLVRLGVVLVNGDGDNYLRQAVDLSRGGLPRARYSPGWGALLAPVAWLAGGRYSPMFLAGSVVNLAVSVLALALVHRFLERHLPAPAAAVLTAILALGQTATLVLVGVEVEPLSLLSVAATLYFLEGGRPALAALSTGLGAASRIALSPFFAVLWVLQLGRHRRSALLALALLAAGVGAYLLTQPASGGYAGIASEAYDLDGGPGSVLRRAASVASSHALRYARLGIPALVWPGAVLGSVPGAVLGLATTAVLGLGGWTLARRWRRGRPLELVTAATVAAGAYLVALCFWPANDGALLRLVVPLSPVLLLALAEGLGAVRARLSGLARAWLVPGLAVLATALALGSGAALAVTHSRSPGPVRDFIAVGDEARGRLPAGPVLSHLPMLAGLVTDHEVVGFDPGADPGDVLDAARESGACSVLLDAIAQRGSRDRDLRSWASDGRAGPVLARRGATTVVALEVPWCPPAPR